MSNPLQAAVNITQVAPAVDWAQGAAEHCVQFYDDDDFLIAVVSEYMSEGFRSDMAALVIATAAHRAALERRWAAQGFDPAAALSSGQYVPLDAAETLSQFMRDGMPDARLFREIIGGRLAAVKKRYPRVRAFGEMVALLWQDGKHEAAIRLEELWNGLRRAETFALLCAYPMKAFGAAQQGEPFLRVCSTHTRVIPSESYAALTDTGARLRAISELQQKAHSLASAITERDAAERSLGRQERELADFFENAFEGLHRADPDGIILWANQAELSMLGYAAEEYVGRPAADFHTEHASAEDLRQRLLRGETVRDYAATLRCKDGSLKHVLINANALWEDGKLVYTRRFTRDVTDRKRLEEELQQRVAQLADADRRKDEFLATLGHELRNPLAPIVSALQLMHVAKEPEKLGRARDIIERQVKRLTRLVDDLLDISRITRSQIQLRKEMVRLTEMVDAALEMVRPLIHERGHRLTLELPSPPVWLFVDRARVEQVLANLLHNAAKYTDLGGLIYVTAYCHGDWLVLTVRDNGVGLPAELREHVFDLFVQGRETLAQARGGLGIGLTLVRTLIELHGGTVEARSEGSGLGAEFVLRLPLQPGPAMAPAAADACATWHKIALPRRFLIVDDNVDAADAMAELLQAMGHSARVSYSGRAALDAIDRFRPELVLLDIAMPEMDGYEVARRLRREYGARAPVLVAVTGFGQECDRDRAKAAGFDHHVVKPLDVCKLESLMPAQ